MDKDKNRWLVGKISHSTRSYTVLCISIALLLSASTAVLGSAPKPRLVSLAPSNTELVAALDATDELIGVSTYCDYPDKVRTIARAGSFISADMERLTRLKPDHVLLVSGQEQLAAKLTHSHFDTIVLNNNKISDIAKNLKKLGQITGKQQKAAILSQRMQESCTALDTIIKSSNAKCRVFYCVWPSPLMTAGKASFLNDVITVCGGTNIAGDISQAYPTYSLEKLVLTNPDLIIMPYEAKNQSFIKKAPWSSLKAVKQNRVFYLPSAKNDMMARPTLRLLTGMAWLTGKIHPELKEQIKDWQQKWTIPSMP